MDIQSLVIDKLKTHLADSSGYQNLDDSTALVDIELDSLAILELIYELEDSLDIKVDAAELHRLETIADIVSAFDETHEKVA